MTDPVCTIPWTHERKQEIRIFVSEEVPEAIRNEVVARFERTVPDLRTVSEVGDFGRGVASELQLQVAVITDPDHSDPLSNWITLGYTMPGE